MKRFRFRLQKVLQYRTLLKDEAKRLLALRTQELRAFEAKVVSLEEEFRRQGLKDGQIIEAASLYISSSYTARLKSEIEKTREEIEQAKIRVKEAMDSYIEASKEEKALTTLKDKKYAQYLEDSGKETQEFLDELAVQRAGVMARNFKE